MAASVLRRAFGPTGKGIISGYLVLTISSFIGVIRTPFLLKGLGSADFGLWATLLSIGSYMALSNIGVGPSVTRMVAAGIGRKDTSSVSTVVCVGVVMQVVASLLLLLLIPLIGPPLAGWLNVEPGKAHVFTQAMLLLFIGVSIRLVANTLLAALTGANAKALSDTLRCIGQITDTVAYVGAALFLHSYVAVALYGIVSSLLLLAITSYCTRSRLAIHISFTRGTSIFRELMTLSPWNLSMAFGAIIVFNTANLVISHLLGPDAVAPYAVAFQLSWFAAQLSFQVSDGLQPLLAQRHWRAGHAESNRLLTVSVEVSTLVGAAITIGLVFLGPWVIGLWVGSGSYVGNSTWFVLALLPLMHGMVHAYASAWLMTNNLRTMALWNALEAVSNVALTIWWGRQWGVVGVALALMVAQGVTNFWYLPWRMSVSAGLSGVVPFTSRTFELIAVCGTLALGWFGYQRSVLGAAGFALGCAVLIFWAVRLGLMLRQTQLVEATPVGSAE